MCERPCFKMWHVEKVDMGGTLLLWAGEPCTPDRGTPEQLPEPSEEALTRTRPSNSRALAVPRGPELPLCLNQAPESCFLY